MSPSSYHRLLGRLLFALGASSVVTGCGGQSTPDNGDGSASAGRSGAATQSCGYGQPERFCLGDATMESMARRGSGQVDLSPLRSDAQVAAAFGENGCLRHDWVGNSCCNPAIGPGGREGDQCCYNACAGPCCGRALVIAGRAQVAEPEPRRDWLVSDGTLTGLAGAARPLLTPAERARLVELWQADALMEHASIASFARFSLQLLAVGAPAQLVRLAQLAGLDEVRHAEHAFSIASRLAGRVIGPGQLPELAAPLETDLCAVARAALVDGCIGEALAALVALEQAHRAGDTAIREALLEVAEDETRHAELAFRFVAWSLARGGQELREALRREVEHRLASLPEPTPASGVSRAALHHYGRLTADEQRGLYRQARDELLRPAFAALLEGAGQSFDSNTTSVRASMLSRGA